MEPNNNAAESGDTGARHGNEMKDASIGRGGVPIDPSEGLRAVQLLGLFAAEVNRLLAVEELARRPRLLALLESSETLVAEILGARSFDDAMMRIESHATHAEEARLDERLRMREAQGDIVSESVARRMTGFIRQLLFTPEEEDALSNATSGAEDAAYSLQQRGLLVIDRVEDRRGEAVAFFVLTERGHEYIRRYFSAVADEGDDAPTRKGQAEDVLKGGGDRDDLEATWVERLARVNRSQERVDVTGMTRPPRDAQKQASLDETGQAGPFPPALSGGQHVLRDAEKLSLHRAVAERLRDRPGPVLAAARNNLVRWLSVDPEAPYYAEWLRILDSASVGDIINLITADTEHARRLRQTTPFVGILAEQERRKALSDARLG